MTAEASTTPDDALGGEAGIRHLVQRFYALMDELPEAYTVRQMHPESLQSSAQSLFEFLSGWFGGPALYVAKKGHPRLRMRHAPYAVGPAVCDECACARRWPSRWRIKCCAHAWSKRFPKWPATCSIPTNIANMPPRKPRASCPAPFTLEATCRKISCKTRLAHL